MDPSIRFENITRALALVILVAIFLWVLCSCSFPGSTYGRSLGTPVLEHVRAEGTPQAKAATQATQNNFWGGAR